MDLNELLKEAVAKSASDVFIVSGLPVSFKINNRIEHLDMPPLRPQDSHDLLSAIYSAADGRDLNLLTSDGDDDFSFSIPGVSRFRISAYKQRGSLAAVIRVVKFELPDPVKLGIPDTVMSLADRQKGLVLVTGPAGSGKSTTLACLIDRINRTRTSHVITLEDPIEYLHSHRQSIVSQREISTDTESFVTALRASLRQAPDVILLGEMRDAETIATAMTAAETGHLVLSTLHTMGAANTIDRIIDAFPADQQAQIRIQLSMVLQAVVSQQLIPTADDGVAAAFEIMFCNGAIKNMIRESKIHQIDSVIFSSGGEGMLSMDASVLSLYKSGVISQQEALARSASPDQMTRSLK